MFLHFLLAISVSAVKYRVFLSENEAVLISEKCDIYQLSWPGIFYNESVSKYEGNELKAFKIDDNVVIKNKNQEIGRCPGLDDLIESKLESFYVLNPRRTVTLVYRGENEGIQIWPSGNSSKEIGKTVDWKFDGWHNSQIVLNLKENRMVFSNQVYFVGDNISLTTCTNSLT